MAQPSRRRLRRRPRRRPRRSPRLRSRFPGPGSGSGAGPGPTGAGSTSWKIRPTGRPSRRSRPGRSTPRASTPRSRRSAARSRPTRGCRRSPRVVRQVSAETGADPFLIAALAYRTSRCRPSSTGAAGIGLLEIQPSMFAPGAPLPFPRADLDREALLDPAHNLRVGIALYKMWQAEHVGDRSRARQHAPPHGAGALLLGRPGLGDDRRGPDADGAPPAAGGVREPAADVPRLVDGVDDRGAARGGDAARDQRPRRRPGGRRALAPRARHRRHHRRAGARGRRRRRAVRRRRPHRRSPGARAVSAPGAPLAQPHHGAGRVLRAHHARGGNSQRLLPPHRLSRRRRPDRARRRDHRHRRAVGGEGLGQPPALRGSRERRAQGSGSHSCRRSCCRPIAPSPISWP